MPRNSQIATAMAASIALVERRLPALVGRYVPQPQRAPRGSRGPRGQRGKAALGFRWRGYWQAGEYYSQDDNPEYPGQADVIHFGGTAYVCVSRTRCRPDEEPEAWEVMFNGAG